MSLFASVQTGCLIAFALLLLRAAWQDWHTMQIADGISLGIIAAFVAWAATGLAAGTFSLLDLALAVACAVGMAMGPNTVVVVRSEYLMGVNNCPNYNPATTANPNEAAMPGFGCADAYNMPALMTVPLMVFILPTLITVLIAPAIMSAVALT